MNASFLEGNEAVAWGAFDAGCRFFAGYPITPATSIFNTMLSLLPQSGGTVLQGEDEIASMGYCLGASMAGLKVMTATSGPGLSLYSEHISFAIGSEIPVVIVDVQRLGPSTGSATKGADGDVQFMRWGTFGGLPVIVLAPASAADCYVLTRHAFNLAERFRCPVLIASNKEIGLTRESVDLDALEKPEAFDRTMYTDDGPFLPFAADPQTGVPPFLPIGHDRTLVRQTSSTHGTNGYITTDPAEIQAFQDRLTVKIENARRDFAFHDYRPSEGARDLIVTYGVSARAARAAVKDLEQAGRPASLLVLKALWPVQEELIRDCARDHERLVVVEMNMGQYVREIRRLCPDKDVAFIGKMDGQLIKPGRIADEVSHG